MSISDPLHSFITTAGVPPCTRTTFSTPGSLSARISSLKTPFHSIITNHSFTNMLFLSIIYTLSVISIIKACIRVCQIIHPLLDCATQYVRERQSSPESQWKIIPTQKNNCFWKPLPSCIDSMCLWSRLDKVNRRDAERQRCWKQRIKHDITPRPARPTSGRLGYFGRLHHLTGSYMYHSLQTYRWE